MTTTSPTPTPDTATSQRCGLLVATAIAIAASTGCTSVIGSAYLREAWLDAVEHAAETNPAAKDAASRTSDDTADGSRPPVDDGDSMSADDEEEVEAAWTPASLDEAVAEADRRLATAGGLTAAARGTLIATLGDTPRQDWPAVIEEFTAALASVQQEAAAAASARGSTMNAGPATPEPQSSPAASAEPVAPMPPAATTLEPARPSAPVEPPHALFAIRNACFASRVRAWGVVDRFETAEFEPGQEVIVYFELDQLSSRESVDGHTTRIDTTLRLVAADGRRVHDWNFEPLEETCGSRRHDYFARYLLSLPDSAPGGPLRLEIVVNDTLAGHTAHAALPLAVVRR